MTAQYAVGVDIGGTSVVSGVLEIASGTLIARATMPTVSQSGHADGLARIEALIDTVLTSASLDRSQIAGIGVGATGPVNSKGGTIHNPFTLPGWDGIPVIPYLTEHFERPACLLGDCDVAALGEHWLGAGRGVEHMLYITVGTGIGGGIIIHNRLYRGFHQMAGEVGHQAIDLNGPECYCGARGCLEILAAGPAIARRALAELPSDSVLSALPQDGVTAGTVAEAARKGDHYAQYIMEQTAFYLAVGIGNLVNIFEPERIILGGGVMRSFDLFAPVMLETLHARSKMQRSETVDLRPAALGLDAGITGAARAICLELGIS